MLALFFGGGSFILVLTGHDTAGAAIASTVIVGLVSLFLGGRLIESRTIVDRDGDD